MLYPSMQWAAVSMYLDLYKVPLQFNFPLIVMNPCVKKFVRLEIQIFLNRILRARDFLIEF